MVIKITSIWFWDIILTRISTSKCWWPLKDSYYQYCLLLVILSIWLLFNNNFKDEPIAIQSSLKTIQKKIVNKNSQLFYKFNGTSLLYPRPSERTQIILQAHKAIIHGGILKTLCQVQSQYYWESLATDVHDVVQCCAICQLNQPLAKKTSFNLVRPKFAFHTVSIDIVGPLHKCAGNLSISS